MCVVYIVTFLLVPDQDGAAWRHLVDATYFAGRSVRVVVRYVGFTTRTGTLVNFDFLFYFCQKLSIMFADSDILLNGRRWPVACSF